MIKIIPSPHNKGFVYSPFIIVALVLISLGLCIHLMESDSRRAQTLSLSGRINSANLKMEEARISIHTAALSSTLSALASGANKTNEQIEEEIASELTDYVHSLRPATLSSVSGNYSIFLDNSTGSLLLTTIEAPQACVNGSKVTVCSRLSIEEVIDTEWIH